MKRDRNEYCIQECFYRHFSRQGHTGFLSYVSVTLIDRMGGSDPKYWKDYSMKMLKTIAPWGIYVEVSV